LSGAAPTQQCVCQRVRNTRSLQILESPKERGVRTCQANIFSLCLTDHQEKSICSLMQELKCASSHDLTIYLDFLWDLWQGWTLHTLHIHPSGWVTSSLQSASFQLSIVGKWPSFLSCRGCDLPPKRIACPLHFPTSESFKSQPTKHEWCSKVVLCVPDLEITTPVTFSEAACTRLTVGENVFDFYVMSV